jgi:hypothetical protein
MRRGGFISVVLLGALSLVAAGFPISAASGDRSSARAGRPYQPDGWIKLCGQSTGCVIDPLPHPWLGKDVYNRTARKQTHSDDINEGEDIRYWIAIQNDGTESDTFGVLGCPGNPTFEVRRVLLGKQKRPNAGATDITRKYKDGTLEFELDPGKKAIFTLLIVTHVNKGVTYICRTEFTSQGNSDRQDVVAAKMTTY